MEKIFEPDQDQPIQSQRKGFTPRFLIADQVYQKLNEEIY